jgi:branched-subunit amino acid aminotransferase/4-amino-4-deoxychorismate lyase
MGALQKGQQVITPDGEGYIEEIPGENIVVKLADGKTQTYTAEDVTDNSSAG